MAEWIFPTKPTIYPADQVFSEYGADDWVQKLSTKSVAIGDIVYLYISSPAREIHWRCRVELAGYYLKKEGCYPDVRVTPDDIYSDGPFIRLLAEEEFTVGGKLSFAALKAHGLKSRLMSPQRVKGELAEYIADINRMQADPLEIEKDALAMSDDMLKVYAQKYSKMKVKVTSSAVKQWSRNAYIAQYTKRRANGVCQLCGQAAPFLDTMGNPYLESHHIKWLSKGGEDSITNTVALCPNCHKKMHIVADPGDVITLLNIAALNAD